MSSNEPDETQEPTITFEVNNASDESTRNNKRPRELSPADEINTKNAKIDVNSESSANTLAIFSAMNSWYSIDSFKRLIESNADIYIKEKDFGYTLLHMAVHSGDQKKFEMLVQKNFDVNAKAKNNVTPLHLAVMMGNVNVVKMLIEYGADVNCLTEDTQLTALHFSVIKCDDMSNVYKEINFCQDSLVSRLWKKSLKNRNPVPIIELLVENEVDVNARDVNRNTALHFATLQFGDNVIEKLLNLGAYIDVRNVNGKTPFINVFESFNTDGLIILLEFGADINDMSRQFQGIREYESSQANASYNSVLEHTNKLRAANLPVTEVYKSDFHKSFWLSHLAECSREVERLKTYFIIDEVSLYDFLHMRIGGRNAFAKHVPKDLEMKFPKYYDIVYGSCRRAVTRRSLVKMSKMVWEYLTEIDFLPEVCFELIFSFLDNADLTFFIAGVRDFLKGQESENIEM